MDATVRGRVWEGDVPPTCAEGEALHFKVNGKLKRGPSQHYLKMATGSVLKSYCA
jgi:hypothetical protein